MGLALLFVVVWNVYATWTVGVLRRQQPEERSPHSALSPPTVNGLVHDSVAPWLVPCSLVYFTRF